MTNYENVTGTIQLEVKADELQSIKTEGNLGKSNYTWGEEFSLKGVSPSKPSTRAAQRWM